MPIIKSSTDLRNNYNEISTFCHESREPVFITKNGQGDPVRQAGLAQMFIIDTGTGREKWSPCFACMQLCRYLISASAE